MPFDWCGGGGTISHGYDSLSVIGCLSELQNRWQALQKVGGENKHKKLCVAILLVQPARLVRPETPPKREIKVYGPEWTGKHDGSKRSPFVAALRLDIVSLASRLKPFRC